MTKIFAERLVQKRKEKGLHKTELAAKSGVNVNTITNYEYCNNMPSLYNACLIADALEVSLDWLVGREGKHDDRDRNL